MSTDAAGFAHATDRSVAPPNGAFDAGLRPGPFPDRAASLLPGLLAATRTGLTPAGDDELPIRSQPLDDHLLIPGRTGWSTSSSSVVSCGVKMLELDAGVLGREPPVDTATGAVACRLPG